ncbi:hypothetical protein KKH81_03000 [Patescibacteria group bacterium]|nr:hypothetical protein [Patescibacteria group bacterium]
MQNTIRNTVLAGVLMLAGCGAETTETRDAGRVAQQQDQYSIGQPIPAFDWSLERHLVIELYKVRNQRVATHSVWRSDYGIIEGDCPSYGYGIPYDTSLTNPLVATSTSADRSIRSDSLTSIEQAEPNGIFASKNTSATWVMCLSQGGSVEPIYVESKVTVYPGPVIVDYVGNRVTRSGAATVLIPRSAPSVPAPATSGTQPSQ